MWLRGVQFVQEEPASAPSTSPSEPRELRQVAACTAGSMVCGWRADARPTARAARATARPVVRAVRACARPMARAARAARPVATGEVSASVGAPPVARAARAWARPMAIGEGGASVVGDSAKTACCDNVPLARYFHHFYAIPMRSRVHLRYRTGERRALSYTRLRQWIQCRARD